MFNRVFFLFTYGLIIIGIQVSHADNIEEVIVTADPLGGIEQHLIQPTQILDQKDLRSRNLANIGETVSQEPGVSASDSGAGSSRPVIRGMAGGRVKVMENGIGTMDASTISNDHAVTTEPVFAKQIEILRGPATLLYGSGASGGLINIVNDRIPTVIPENGVEGDALIQYDSVFDGYLGAASINIGSGYFALHLDGMKRDTDDYTIPGFAELEPDAEEQPGTLENSSVESDNVTGGLSFITSRGYLGFSVSNLSSNYGIPGAHHHEEEEEGGVRIDMEQTRYDFKAALDKPFQGIHQIKTRWGYNDYEHAEVEPDGAIGTLFGNEELEGRIEVLHEPLSNWDGVIGLQINDRDFAAVGEEGFVPPSQQNAIAVFLLEKIDFNDWHFDLGFRYEDQDSSSASASIHHSAISLSGGANWNYRDRYQLGASIGRTQRAPTIEELFANGPHLATSSFEIGDTNLDEETSTNFDLYWRKTEGKLTFTVNFFYNKIDNFIYLQESDLNNDGFADRVEEDFSGDIADILAPAEDEEPLLLFQSQHDAEFLGFELESIFRLVEDNRGVLDLRLWADYVQAELDNGNNLPRITPWRLGSGLNFERGSWHVSLDYIHVNKQNRTAPLETNTDGHNMLNGYAGYTFNYNEIEILLFVRGSNLLDAEARRHTSFVKNLAPLPGRSGIFGLRVVF